MGAGRRRSKSRIGLPSRDGRPTGAFRSSGRRRGQIGLRWTGVLLIAAAAAVAFAPLSPSLVERMYSTSAYLRIQRIITSTSNLVPFALFDVLLIATVAAWLTAFGVDLARDRGAWMRSPSAS